MGKGKKGEERDVEKLLRKARADALEQQKVMSQIAGQLLVLQKHRRFLLRLVGTMLWRHYEKEGQATTFVMAELDQAPDVKLSLEGEGPTTIVTVEAVPSSEPAETDAVARAEPSSEPVAEAPGEGQS